MINDPHIYAVIIGSEILDRRRDDKHFDYLSSALQKKGFTLYASFLIKDDEALITQTYELIKKDKKAIIFSFGGIGATPDDLTRQLAANVFADGKLYRHKQFEKDIIKRLGERAYPFPIKMADLPLDAALLFNPVNNMSGFHLQKRFFFMPGFPQMAHPMVDEIVSKYLPSPKKLYTKRIIAMCSEGKIAHLMTKVPKEIELSSLPMINEGNYSVEFSLSSEDADSINKYFRIFTDFLEEENIGYRFI